MDFSSCFCFLIFVTKNVDFFCLLLKMLIVGKQAEKFANVRLCCLLSA
jgi:hypothetical protein